VAGGFTGAVVPGPYGRGTTLAEGDRVEILTAVQGG